MAVITIPIGGQAAQIEVPDFAMESTQQQILAANQAMAAALSSLTGEQDATGDSVEKLASAVKNQTNQDQQSDRDQKKRDQQQSQATKALAKGIDVLQTERGSELVKKVSDSLGLGLFGGVLGSSIGVLEMFGSAMNKVARVGVGVGDDFLGLKEQVSDLGISLEEFALMSLNHSEALAAFGESTSDGQQRFIKLNNEFLEASRNIGYFGMSTNEMTKLLADELETRRLSMESDQFRTMQEKELAATLTEQIKQQTALARFTGQDVQERIKQGRALRRQAVVQSFLADAGEDAQKSFKIFSEELGSLKGGDQIAEALTAMIASGGKFDPRQFAPEIFALIPGSAGQDLINFVRENVLGKGLTGDELAVALRSQVQEVGNAVKSNEPFIRDLAILGNSNAQSLITIDQNLVQVGDLTTKFTEHLENLNKAMETNSTGFVGLQAQTRIMSEQFKQLQITALMRAVGVDDVTDANAGLTQMVENLSNMSELKIMEVFAKAAGRTLGEMSGTFDLAQLMREAPQLVNGLTDDGSYEYTDPNTGERRTGQVNNMSDVFTMLKNTGGGGVDNAIGLTTALMAQLGVPGMATANMVNVAGGLADEAGINLQNLAGLIDGSTVNIGNWEEFKTTIGNLFKNRDEAN
jgi:hypothetical protein